MSSKRGELVPKTNILTRAFHRSHISTMCSGRGGSSGTNTLSSRSCGGNISESYDDSSDDSSDDDGTNLAENLKLMKGEAHKRKWRRHTRENGTWKCCDGGCPKERRPIWWWAKQGKRCTIAIDLLLDKKKLRYVMWTARNSLSLPFSKSYQSQTRHVDTDRIDDFDGHIWHRVLG